MADVIVGREADGQNVSVVVLSELFVGDSLFGERNKQVVAEWRVVERGVEISAGRFRAAGNDVRESIRVVSGAGDCFPRRRVGPGAIQVLVFSEYSIPFRAEMLTGRARVVERRD